MVKKTAIWLSVCLVLIILSGMILFRYYGFYRVYGNSMEPSLLHGDLVMINYQEKEFPQRGDIILFYYGHENRDYVMQNNGEFGLIGYDVENNYYIKRVIGLPGDFIEIKNNQLWINHQKVKELHIKSKIDNFGPSQVPTDSVFVLGENSKTSFDSRDFGPIKISRIKGTIVSNWHIGRS